MQHVSRAEKLQSSAHALFDAGNGQTRGVFGCATRVARTAAEIAKACQNVSRFSGPFRMDIPSCPLVIHEFRAKDTIRFVLIVGSAP